MKQPHSLAISQLFDTTAFPGRQKKHGTLHGIADVRRCREHQIHDERDTEHNTQANSNQLTPHTWNKYPQGEPSRQQTETADYGTTHAQ